MDYNVERLHAVHFVERVGVGRFDDGCYQTGPGGTCGERPAGEHCLL